MAEDLFTINSLTGKIISVAPTLNKSNFNRSIYYLLYMTIPSGGPRIKADFARKEKVLINKCLCDFQSKLQLIRLSKITTLLQKRLISSLQQSF